MKYLCLIYDDPATTAAMTPAQMEAELEAHGALDRELRATDQLLGGEALHPAASATTVRIREGRLVVTDGPFAETREQLGGFYLIDAPDLDAAIAIAARIPSAASGSIEVRPCVDFSQPGAMEAAFGHTGAAAGGAPA